MTLDHDRSLARARIVIISERSSNIASSTNAIGKRQTLIHPRYAVVHDHIGLFPHVRQDLRARQRGTDPVSIGPGMRRNHEPASPANLL